MEFKRTVKKSLHYSAAVAGLFIEEALLKASGPQTFGKTAAEVIVFAAAYGHLSLALGPITIPEEQPYETVEASTELPSNGMVQTVDNVAPYSAYIASYGQQGSFPVE